MRLRSSTMESAIGSAAERNRQRGGPKAAARPVDDDIGNRQRGGPKTAARPVDDDIGNRQRGGPNASSSSGNEAPRPKAPPKIDDDIGNR